MIVTRFIRSIDSFVPWYHGRSKGKKVRVMRRILLILMVAVVMVSVLAFGSSGVAFAQDEPAVLADDVTEDEKCADLAAEYEESVVEGNAGNMGGVAEEIEYCLAQVVEGQE
jgi:cytoskeletal protein RodZ